MPAATLPEATPAPAGASPWVSAYYAGYAWDSTGPDPALAVAAVDTSTLTHLIFARYAPGAGTLGGTAGDLVPGAGTGHAQVERALVAKAHAGGARALAMIGGAGDGPGFAASTTAGSRAAFIRNVLDMAVARDYDGVDLDWEDGLDDPGQQAQLVALLTELRSASASRPRYSGANAPFLLTLPHSYVNLNTDLPVPPWKARVASLVDQFNLMTYGMYFDCCGWQSWFWAALQGAAGPYPESVESSVQAYVDAGVPRSKIGIGLGLYGGGYTAPVTGPRQAISASWGGDDNTNTWADFVASGLLNAGEPLADPNYRFDTAAQAGYYTYSPARRYRGTDVSVLVTEDLQSIAAKGAWVRKGNAGGTIVWTINYGYVPALATNPPMNTVKRSFLAR